MTSRSPITFANDGTTNTVHIGGVQIVFSYDATVAFTGRDGRSYVNPRYRKFSRTTSKHIHGAGYAKAPDAPSEDAFNAYLADALRAGAIAAQEDVCASI